MKMRFLGRRFLGLWLSYLRTGMLSANEVSFTSSDCLIFQSEPRSHLQLPLYERKKTIDKDNPSTFPFIYLNKKIGMMSQFKWPLKLVSSQKQVGGWAETRARVC